MRRQAAAVLVAVVVLVAGAGLATAAFTTHRSTPQEFAAADSFGPPPAGELEADSRTNDGGVSSSQIQLGLRLRNTGDSAVPLDVVTMRYWFTSDAVGSPQSACYYATVGCGQLDLQVRSLSGPHAGADHYLDVGFTGGQLAPGAAASLDQLAILDQSGESFDQQDDHSFLDQDSFASNVRVTVYVGGDLVWGVEPEAVPAVEDVEVRYANGDQDPTDPAIKPHLMVVNTGTVQVDVQHVTVRYWFTRDAASADLLGFCDYAEIGCDKVLTSFVPIAARPGADTYLEVGFDPLSLQVDDSTGPMQLRVHHADYAPFDETDDYSWDTNTAFAASVTVTAYLRGRLVWGVEP